MHRALDIIGDFMVFLVVESSKIGQYYREASQQLAALGID